MKSKVIASIILILCAVLISGVASIASTPRETYGLKSQGRIVFDNDTADTSDDVIFDARDLYDLAEKCQ